MKQLKKIMITLLFTSISMMALAAEQDMQGMGMQGGMKHDMQGMGGEQGGMKHDMQGMGRMHGEGGMMDTEHLKQMQAHLLLMHDLSNKILAEKDPKKQQALKDQQLAVMKAHMADRMAKRHNMQHPAPEGTKK
jgi:hypothetical protein